MFDSEKKGQGLYTAHQRWLVSGSLEKKICASDYQSEIQEPSEIRWSTCLPRLPHGGAVRKICRDMEMQNETGHTSAWSDHFKAFKARLEVLRPAEAALLTVWFSWWSERSPPVPRSRTSLRWRWLWLPLKRWNTQGRDPPVFTYQRRWKSEMIGRNRLLVWEDFRCVLTRGELLPRLCNKKKEMNEATDFLWLSWQQARSSVVTKPFGLWPSGLPVHSLATTDNSDKGFFLRCRLPHLRLSIRFAGQQYSRCFMSVNPSS